MGLTAEEQQQIQDLLDAGDDVGANNLLIDFVLAGKLTEEVAAVIFETGQFPSSSAVTPLASTTNQTALESMLRKPGRAPLTMQDVLRTQVDPALLKPAPAASSSNATQLDPEVAKYLNGYTSNQDLMDRLVALGADEATAIQTYNDILGIKPNPLDFDNASQEAIDRKASMYYRAGVGRDSTERLKLAQNEAKLMRQLEADQTEADRYYKLTPWLNQNEVDRFNLKRDTANEKVTARDKFNSDTQRANALINPVRNYQDVLAEWQAKQPAPIPNEPSAASVIDPILAGIGAPSLRAYVASRLPGIIANTAQDRTRWHKEQNAPVGVATAGNGGLTYQDAVDRLRSEANKWGAMAAVAPTDITLGNVAFGVEGGLKTIATQAQQTAQDRLTALTGAYPDTPEGRTGYYDTMGGGPEAPVKPVKTEDPLRVAINLKKLTEDYMAQAPGARGYNIQRLAPTIRSRR